MFFLYNNSKLYFPLVLEIWLPEIIRELEIHFGSAVYLRSPSLSLSCFGLLIGGVFGRGALLLFVSLLKKGELFLEFLATSLNTGEPICSCIYLEVCENNSVSQYRVRSSFFLPFDISLWFLLFYSVKYATSYTEWDKHII